MQIFKAVCDWTVQGESQQAINIKSDEELYLVFSNVRFALMEKDELHVCIFLTFLKLTFV